MPSDGMFLELSGEILCQAEQCSLGHSVLREEAQLGHDWKHGLNEVFHDELVPVTRDAHEPREILEGADAVGGA